MLADLRVTHTKPLPGGSSFPEISLGAEDTGGADEAPNSEAQKNSHLETNRTLYHDLLGFPDRIAYHLVRREDQV